MQFRRQEAAKMLNNRSLALILAVAFLVLTNTELSEGCKARRRGRLWLKLCVPGGDAEFEEMADTSFGEGLEDLVEAVEEARW